MQAPVSPIRAERNGQRNVRATVDGRSEIVGVAEEFNSMLDARSPVEEALSESEATLRRAQAIAHIGSWNLDLTDNRLTWSEETYRILGVSPGVSLSYNAFLAYTHPHDRAAVDAAWQAALKGAPYDIVHRIVVRDEIKWVRERAELALDAAGNLRAGVGTVQDVTEIEGREDELRRFRVAMDATADAIYVVDRASMHFIDVNEAACRMQSHTREELLALGPDGVLSISREELERTYDSVIAGGSAAEPIEMLRRRKDGVQAWIEIRRHARRFGESWMIVTVARDITARKQAEQTSRDSAAQLRLFADNVPALTVSWDENLRCRFANKMFAEFFGLAGQDIIGKHVREVLGEEVYREIEGYFVQVLQGHPVTYQRISKRPDGESRYIEVKLLPQIGDQGKILGCFAVTTDITEHKLTEERIQRVAYHDSLTGLPNRLLFNDLLNQSISLAKRRSRQFALLYLDLDKFKPVNDTLGHAADD